MMLLSVDLRRIILLVVGLISSLLIFSTIDHYNAAQTRLYTLIRQYTQESEYYQKKADVYRQEALYYRKKAEGYQHEAAYYSRKGDANFAKDYNRRAEKAMDEYKNQMRYAANADDKAANYQIRVKRLLQK